MRNDFQMKNTNFLNYFDKFDDYRMDEVKIFKKRIVVSTVYTCKVFFKNKGVLVQDNCFRFTDWWHFGLREDVLKLWNIPFENDPCYKGLANDKKDKKIVEKMLVPADKFHEEQYLWGNLAKMNGIDFEMIDETDFKLRNAIISEKLLVNNAVVVDFEKSGFRCLKLARRFCLNDDLYFYCDWLSLYKKYCNEAFDLCNNIYYKAYKTFAIAKSTCCRHVVRTLKAWHRFSMELKGCVGKKCFLLVAFIYFVIFIVKCLYECVSVTYYGIKTCITFILFWIVKRIRLQADE